MQGLQYSKDTVAFEEKVAASHRDKLLTLLASAGVFLALAVCLLLLGSKSALVCTVEGASRQKTGETVTCEDISGLYTCVSLPVRLSIVLQVAEDSYIRFNSACKWSPGLVQIRLLVLLIAAITLYQGLSGLYHDRNSQLKAFSQLVPVAISLLIALICVDLKGNAGLLEYESDLLNALTGSQFEGFVQTLTFAFSTFYVYSPTVAYAGAAGLIAVARVSINANLA